jgi:hypothetical protein
MKKIILALVAMSLAAPALGMGSAPRKQATVGISSSERQIATSIYYNKIQQIDRVATVYERSTMEVNQAINDMRAAWQTTQTTNDRQTFGSARNEISMAGARACEHIVGC